MGLVQRSYVSAGTAVASVVGVRQLSDAFANNDAVDGHEQSTGERVSKGLLGSVQVVATALGIKAGLGATGLAAAGGDDAAANLAGQSRRMTGDQQALKEVVDEATNGEELRSVLTTPTR